MNDDFVLNTYTGDIWRVDEKRAVFKLIQKDEPLLKQIEQSLILLDLVDEMSKTLQDLSEQEMMKLQDLNQMRAQSMQTIANVIKQMNDQQKSIIENLR